MTTEAQSMKVLWLELVLEIIWTLLGVLVYSLGATLFGDTMIILGIIGLGSWPFRFVRAKRHRANQPPAAT